MCVTAPESFAPAALMVALEKQHHAAVHEWWRSLSDDTQAEFLEVLAANPEHLCTPVTPEDLEFDETPDDWGEWYEYIVNQDARFYYDRSNPIGTYNIVYPIISPISNAADIEVVNHLLSNPKRSQ